MALTYVQYLDQIDTAIQNIISGSQSYAINGRQFTKADLNTLWKMRTQVKDLAMAEQEQSEGTNSDRTLVKFNKAN